MAFISLRHRHKCAIFILFNIGIYFAFSFYFMRTNLKDLNYESELVANAYLETESKVDNFEKIIFTHNEDILDTYQTKNKENIEHFQTNPGINPNDNFDVHNILAELDRTVATNAPLPHSRQHDVNKLFDSYSSKTRFSSTELKISEQQSSINDRSKYEIDLHEKDTSSNSSFNSYAKPTKNPAFIIDTSGCRIPKLDPWDLTTRQFIELLDPLICSDRPLFMTPEPNGIVHLNESVLQRYYNSTVDDIECFYEGVFRLYKPDMIREDIAYVTIAKPLQFDTPLEYDHIAVTCNFSNGYMHEQYLPLVRLKESSKHKASSSKLNVILLGIDSISKLNFFRHFRRTKGFLKDKMNTFDMKGYTKVADNTFPNLVPMLTGHFVDYFWNESMADTFFFDNISLIWKDYSKHGYRTFYAEDKPYDGTFNYFRRGFFEQPTDYYYRTLALLIEVSDLKAEAEKYNSTCLNSELEMDLINDYLKNFVKTMDGRPYFAFAMHSSLTHDILNYASYADVPTVRLLEKLDNEGALNNTMLIIFSDHGIRYGDIRFTYIGKFEERMPFMYIHVPEWFLKQHPDIKKNLKINQNRLITLFDVHATLKHLLNLDQNVPNDTGDLGLSLFREIPENRTCSDAHILPHWCTCNDFNPVAVTDTVVSKCANALVDHINEQLHSYADVCEKLHLHEIKDALLGLPNELVLKFAGHKGIGENAVIGLGGAPPTLGDYLITLTTQPGDAMFEGTVRYDDEKDNAKVMGISRINMYGKQSWCIDSAKLKLYCYCKTYDM